MENENADYVHGSDLLVGILVEDVFNPLGHSKTCTITNTAETKDRAVKPTLEEKAKAAAAGKWKEKSVSGLSVSISSEGFVFYGDGMGYDKLLEMWESGNPVPVKYALRGEEDTEEVSAADDDATYSISLENSGPVEVKVVTPKA